MTPREAYIALNMMERVGPVRVRALEEALGSVETIFTASREDLLGVNGVGDKLADTIIRQRETLRPDKEEKRAVERGVRIVTRLDAEYPARLKSIHDPPLVLYVWGTLEERDQHAIAVIGSRRCSHYGLQMADRLAFQLGNVGYCVVSGLARGIDTAGHKGALKGPGRTIAVLGSALDRLYPEENDELAKQISKQGAVISEYPFGTPPSKTTFPMRNRIVTGLSVGVLVVEAARRSGAMISVDEATSQGRLIFAVPGRVDNPSASGCHMLIKNGAKLVEDVRDVTEEFEYLFQPTAKVASAKSPAAGKAASASLRPRPKLNENETKVVEALSDQAGGELDVDSLIRASGLPPATVSAVLVGLELKRMVKMLPGRRVVLVSGN